MYLSRVLLDITNRNTMRALAFPNKFHGAIESCFRDDRKRKLWRLDKLGDEIYVIILSEEKPDLSLFCAQFSPSGSIWESKNYTPFLESLENDTIWRFRLTSCPTICFPSKTKEEANTDKRERGKVRPHLTIEHQKQWLINRSEKHGFKLFSNGFDIVQSKLQHFYKRDRHNITLSSVTYEGVLSITDVEAFRKSLIDGIGRGKAYGMGLMTIMHI